MADYYDAILVQKGASRAVNILADECRVKDTAIATLTADLADLRKRNERMRGFIQRLGYGHTDWPEQKIGCGRPGPGCVPQCQSRCSNVDHLNVTVYDLRADLDRLRGVQADLDRLRAVWRAVAAEMVGDWGDMLEPVVSAAVAAGLAARVPYDPEEHDQDLVTVLTPDGRRLARGGA